MSFFTKFLSSLLIIIVIYVLAVFLFPNEVDRFSKKISLYEANMFIRNVKLESLKFSDKLLNVKSSQDVIGKAKDIADSANQAIDSTKDVITKKIEQTNKVIKNGEKVINATTEFKESVSELSSLSGSVTGSGN
ncbi:MAG: hypothetical protein PHS92_01655 [Candidatus Gracilibacteria bacterium]|nr:hypothetical protein [Candidatus Gracilibacteria bacterium]